MPKSPVATPTPAAKPLPAVVAPALANLTGTLHLIAGSGQKIAAGEVADGLVYYLPQGGAPKPRPGNFSITTQSKGFLPNLLVVPVGSTIAFPNKDTILHNVYSRTPGSEFELGTYGPGEIKKTVLRTQGLVIVNCNVHHNMRANIVVLSTPYYARPGKDGSFQLAGVPAGKGTLVFWHPRSNAVTQLVTIGGNAPVVKQLTATKARLDAHMLMGN
ncbi:MAG: hypothetical protein ABIP44_05915 [Pseudoxanthomonas sp.]